MAHLHDRQAPPLPVQQLIPSLFQYRLGQAGGPGAKIVLAIHQCLLLVDGCWARAATAGLSMDQEGRSSPGPASVAGSSSTPSGAGSSSSSATGSTPTRRSPSRRRMSRTPWEI